MPWRVRTSVQLGGHLAELRALIEAYGGVNHAPPASAHLLADVVEQAVDALM